MTIYFPTNVEFSRNLPANNLKIQKAPGSYRIAQVAFEALPLVSMYSPKLGFAGNIAGLALRDASNLKKGHKLSALTGAIYATVLCAKPLETAQVTYAVSAIVDIAKGVQQLYNKQFSNAGKSLLSIGFNIIYLGALATANPQMIAISVVAQAAFSLHRAYQYNQKGLIVEALINTVISGFNGVTAYNLRSDIFVPKERYQAAFVELKDWALEKQTQIAQAISQFNIAEAKDWVVIPK